MNLDEFTSFAKLDSLNMLGEIDNLPDQLRFAWELGQKLPEPWNDTRPAQGSIRQVILCGMGGSAIGADLVIAYLAPISPVPIFFWRDYGLPAWARGPETLVIVSSHSGNTEEMLDTFESAHKAGCLLLAICTGGELQQKAQASGQPLWMFEHAGQPRAAVGFSFDLILAALSRLGLTGESGQTTAAAIAAAGSAMKKQQETLLSHLPAVKNPAKRQAGQLVGRWVNVYGAGYLAPVARRWKTQLNELAKAGAGFEILPEADHNALAGLGFPINVQSQTLAIFLHSAYNDPRNHLRADLTRHNFTVEGLNTDVYEAKGNSPLEQMWTALHFGDYVAYYLAMIYGVDPTHVETLESFKAAMKVASGHVSI